MIRCARPGLFPGGFPGPAGANAPVDSGGSGTVPAKGPNTSVFFRHGLSMGKNMWDYRAHQVSSEVQIRCDSLI